MASLYCADCGATVTLGQKRCWICHCPLPWQNDADKAAANAVAEQSAQRTVARFHKYPWTIAGFVIAATLMLPAIVVAFCVTFFVTCLVSTPDGTMYPPIESVRKTSIEVALVVFIAFVILLTFLGRSAFRKIPV